MIKEFFRKNDHLCFQLQHLSVFGGGWRIRVYNTSYDMSCSEPIFEHFVSDFDISNLNVDFDMAIMTPVIIWWEKVNSKSKEVE